MKKMVKLPVLFAVLLGVAGCNGDDGPECLTDEDCTPPETCQPDNTCAYIPDPDANKATVAFAYMEVNFPGVHGEIAVDGKFDGKYLYMAQGGLVEFIQAEDHTEMQLLGLITNTLLNALVMRFPRDCPVSQQIKFGAGGIANGTLDRVELDSEGYEIGRTSVGEIVGGYIVFGEYGYNTGSPISGNGEVHFLPID
jgi:predicted small lipoprotein YifL